MPIKAMEGSGRKFPMCRGGQAGCCWGAVISLKPVA